MTGCGYVEVIYHIYLKKGRKKETKTDIFLHLQHQKYLREIH